MAPRFSTFLRHLQQLRRIDIHDGARADLWENIRFKPRKEPHRIAIGQPISLIGDPLGV